ncbi:5-(carboxyamino)imidazole ribonucleotide mutase [Patescibacteria group bacterium]|nr:5-(carboxyamino)imidazole ribonucleotide mutase [Patescibacteria group bacterium]
MAENKVGTFGSGDLSTSSPALVGIIMGSDSDLPIMQDAAKLLEEFGVASEVTVVSAHRTPERLYEYAKGAEAKGIRVIIAGAGGAAHLPGMTAALTPLPVIGVPVATKTAGGIDSLFSIAQMPFGVPVATVAINGAKNAGLLALQILGAGDDALRAKVAAYKQKMEEDVLKKASAIEEKGFSKYLSDSGLV